jgi:tetratricopeptide (TPR) repeat protein
MDTKKTWIEDLWERKTFKYLGTYLAVGFGLLQFVEFISARYHLSEHFIDLYLVVWLTLLPAIVILGYFGDELHLSTTLGLPKWSKFLVISNIILALLLGGFLFNEKAIAQSEIVELIDEEGKKVKVVVPSLNKVKSVACFQFENLTGDKKLDWWSSAFSELLMFNLEQRPEFYVLSAHILFDYYDELGLPTFILPSIAMQRKIAQKTRNEYFSRISYTIEKEQFIFKGHLYNTNTGKPVLNIDVNESDPYIAIDKIKEQITINIPNAFETVENHVSLPASSLITNNQKALEAYIASILMANKEPNKLEKALSLAKKSINLDPSCAFCQYTNYALLYSLARTDEALLHLKHAVKYGVSLPKRMQVHAKAVLYERTNKMEAYIDLYEMHRKQFPYDFGAYALLISLYKTDYGIDSAKSLVYEAIDKGNIERGLVALYDLQLENEEYIEAEKTLKRLSTEFPDREQDKLKYATIYENQGRLEEAKAILLELETIDPLDSDIQIKLADLDFKNLEFPQAYERIEQGFQQATTLSDSLEFLNQTRYFLQESGQIAKALTTMTNYETILSKKASYINILFNNYLTKADLYYSINQPEKVEKLLFPEIKKYSPDKAAYYHCNANMAAMIYKYPIIVDKDFFPNCGKLYQHSNTSVNIAELLDFYRFKDYTNCLKIIDQHENTLKKLAPKFFIADIYAKAGNPKKAKEILKKAIDEKPADPIYYYRMAALLAKEDKVEAQKYLDIALQFWANADADYIPLQRANELAETLEL